MTQPIIASVADGVGQLTLNRPEVLNALNLDTVRELAGTLAAWRDDTEVGLVILDGAGERGFSAGGDLRELRAQLLAGSIEEAAEFFRLEYRLDTLVAEFPKPVVSILDGVTMGGGIGLGGHARIRIVTERSKLAMPETRIGFTPDVGGSWLLASAPGELGVHLGLTASTMDAADAIHAGFADFFVPSESLGHLVQALAERADPGSPAEIVMLFDETPGPSTLALARDWVDACYSAPTVVEIIRRLRAFSTGRAAPGLDLGAEDSLDPDAASRASSAGDRLSAVSPTSLVATLASVRRARTLGSLREALEQEFRLVAWLLTQPDLAEGIRAQLIDRDGAPAWSPPQLEGVDATVIARVLETPHPHPVFAAAPPIG